MAVEGWRVQVLQLGGPDTHVRRLVKAEGMLETEQWVWSSFIRSTNSYKDTCSTAGPPFQQGAALIDTAVL